MKRVKQISWLVVPALIWISLPLLASAQSGGVVRSGVGVEGVAPVAPMPSLDFGIAGLPVGMQADAIDQLDNLLSALPESGIALPTQSIQGPTNPAKDDIAKAAHDTFLGAAAHPNLAVAITAHLKTTGLKGQQTAEVLTVAVNKLSLAQRQDAQGALGATNSALKNFFDGETSEGTALVEVPAEAPGANGAGLKVLDLGFAGKFVVPPLGEFQMGSPTDEDGRCCDETPHTVKITRPFAIGQYPVTQALWKEIMDTNPSHFQWDDLPVEKVSWEDAQEFINKLNKRTGKKFRLPTETEWEYAARAGTTNSRYGDIDAIAWYDGNSRGRTRAVGKKQPNAWGIYDMLGNVWEWTNDWFGDYPKRTVTDPTGPKMGSYRVFRGGSWFNDIEHARSADRESRAPGHHAGYLGFRLALDP